MKILETMKAGRRRVMRTSSVPVNKTDAKTLKRELNTWLAGRTIWNHGDWEGLLGDLRTKGYSDLIDTPKGRDAIGLYLEKNKKPRSC
ncbi:MAG: hypothetical protein V2A66_02855 [Pseudomonadota bacterium]